MPLHSSLGNKSETPSQKTKRTSFPHFVLPERKAILPLTTRGPHGREYFSLVSSLLCLLFHMGRRVTNTIGQRLMGAMNAMDGVIVFQKYKTCSNLFHYLPHGYVRMVVNSLFCIKHDSLTCIKACDLVFREKHGKQPFTVLYFIFH